MPNLRRAVALGAAAMAAAGAVVFASPAANAADNAGPPGLPDCSTGMYDDGSGAGVFDFLNNIANGDPGAPDFQAVCPMARFLPPLGYGGDRDARRYDTRYDSHASRDDGHSSDNHNSDSHNGDSHSSDTVNGTAHDTATDSSRDRDRDSGPRLFPFPDAPRFF